MCINCSHFFMPFLIGCGISLSLVSLWYIFVVANLLIVVKLFTHVGCISGINRKRSFCYSVANNVYCFTQGVRFSKDLSHIRNIVNYDGRLKCFQKFQMVEILCWSWISQLAPSPAGRQGVTHGSRSPHHTFNFNTTHYNFNTK